jgi:hypothetical protein
VPDLHKLTFAFIADRSANGRKFYPDLDPMRAFAIFLLFGLYVYIINEPVAAQTVQLQPGTVLHFDCPRDLNKYPEPRQALVIGESSYDGITWPPLEGVPLNDALDMAHHLCDIGFSVDLGADLDSSKFRDALLAFEKNTPKRAVRLFYYSGHGLEANGVNYMIPLGIQQGDVATKAPKLDDIFSALDDDRLGGNVDLTKIIILDACRDLKGRIGSGLGRPDNAPNGSVIAYATAPASSSTASGDNQRNSLYTEYLLRQIGVPGLSLEELFNRVRNDVYRESSHLQIPWESSSTLTKFLFEPALKIEKTELEAPDPDDLVIVSINGSPVIENWRGAAQEAWIDVTGQLRPGANSLTVQVYNDKTMVGNQPTWWPGAKREGWRYSLNLKLSGTDAGSWNDRQDDGVDDAHWGALFTTLTGMISVDAKTGKVAVSNILKLPH